MRHLRLLILFIIVMTGWLPLSPAQARHLPLWEIGMGLGGLYLPSYRGAAEKSSHMIPFPYIIYRGDAVNIDEGGVRGRIFRSDDIKLDLSLAGGVPVTSDGDGPRSGMPELDPTAEIGPSLELHLWHSDDHRRHLWLALPIRSVFSVSFSAVAMQGWNFTPYLEYSVFSPEPGDWELGLSWGPLYADSAYHNYYYEVAAEHATATRSEYHASSGYSGQRITLAIQKKFGDLWLGIFARYDSLANAVFLPSPLVEVDRYLATGFGLTWIFSKSQASAENVGH